jgi:hypothetical protein
MKHVLLGALCSLLAATPLAWCVRNEATDRDKPGVQLRDAVEVKRNRVWLSDLLPADAPSAMQKAGAAIELCPAPLPGSARILDAEQITSKLVRQPEVLRQLVIPPRITIRYAGWPIAEKTIRIGISKFLCERYPQQPSPREKERLCNLPDGARLEGLQPFAAREEHPNLQVIGLDWDTRQQSVQVRLRCSTQASCGSFLVHVVLPASMGDEWRARLGWAIGLNSPTAGQPAPATTSGIVLAERGKPATLILDDGSMRISVRVICLQPGVLNQQIRVFEAQSRRVFHAEVVGAGLLHSTL